MRENDLRILCSVIKTDMVFEAADGGITPLFDNTADSPLVHSSELRASLKNGISGQQGPFLYKGEAGLYFAAVKAEGGLILMGPMLHEKLKKVHLRQVLRSYGVDTGDLRELPVFTLPEIRNRVLLANSVAGGTGPEEGGMISFGDIPGNEADDHRRDQEHFLLKEEEENDDAAYRHGYHEELLLMQAIREGRTKDAVRLAENMDDDSGRLSENYFRHRRNLAIVGIALCSRAAIDGGLSPEAAYRVSGYYIGKCDAAQEMPQLLYYRNRAIEELTDRVAEKLNSPRSSNYVEIAKDYIRKHYREKIYLSEVADTLGISEGYLSRQFRKETGGCFQDYINEERVARASNLLLYSDFSLAQIAEYVNFPNQSYFGKIFKKYKNMTPRAFRDRFRNKEAFG